MDTRIPTHSSALNEILGGGLIPKGLVEIYGDEGAGKTGLALSVSQSHPLFFFDLDGTFPEELAQKVAKDVWWVAPPMKRAKDIMEGLADIKGVVVALDPVGVMGRGELARMVPMLHAKALKDDLCIIIVNHCDLLGKSVGHHTLGIYASQRIEVRMAEEIKKKRKGRIRTVGMRIALRCTKDVSGEHSMKSTEEEIIF